MKYSGLVIIFIQLDIGGVPKKIMDISTYLQSYRPLMPIYIILRRQGQYGIHPPIFNKNVTIINYEVSMRIRPPYFFPIFVIIQLLLLRPAYILSFLDFSSFGAILAKILFLKNNARIVVSQDNFTSQTLSGSNLSILRYWLIRLLYPHADKIIMCTEATKKDLSTNFKISYNKILVVKNWTHRIPNDIYTKYKKTFDLLYVGRLDPLKNVIFLLKIFHKLSRRLKSATFAIVGEGSDKEKLNTYVIKNGLQKKVFLVGGEVDTLPYYLKSKIFIFAPHPKSEGFPLSILEAFASNVPVVTRNFEGAAEVLHTNTNGFIVRSSSDFVSRLQYLLNHPKPKKSVATNALQYVRKHHSTKNIKLYLNELGI